MISNLEIIFGLPEEQHDPFALSDAVYAAGFRDAVVGTGRPGIVAVALEASSEDASADAAARAIMEKLPKGSVLREIRHAV